MASCAVVAAVDQLTAVATVSVNASDIAFVTWSRVLAVHLVSANINALSSTTGHTKVVDTSMNRSIHQVQQPKLSGSV